MRPLEQGDLQTVGPGLGTLTSQPDVEALARVGRHWVHGLAPHRLAEEGLAVAVEKAKAIAMPRLRNYGAAMATVPWLAAEVDETIALMGEDYWPYGLAPNRVALENSTRYAFEQGLTQRKLDIEELFVPSTLEQSKR